MGDKAIRGNKLTKGPHGHGYKPHLSTHAKGGRAGHFGGGRTRLLEELGRVEAEPSNRNRRAEISRVHGELNRGYAKGGRAGYFAGSLVKNIPKLLKKLGTEIKAQPLPPKLQKTLDEVKKLQKLQKPGVKKAAGGRAGYAIGGIAAAQLKGASNLYKKYKRKKKLAKDTKKGKFPETESLTHQKGPYVGDVGSERPGIKRREWKRPDWPKRPGPKRPERPKRPDWKPMPSPRPKGKWEKPIGKFPREKGKWEKPIGKFPPEKGKWQAMKKGGKADKKWIQKAVNPKHKGYCTPMTKKTCTPARKALARTFKKKAKTGWG